MTYTLPRVIDLSDQGWPNCSITFSSFDYNEIQKYKSEIAQNKPIDEQTKIIDLMKSKFISGSAIDEQGKKVDIEVDKLGELPLLIFNYCIDSLFGKPAPN